MSLLACIHGSVIRIHDDNVKRLWIPKWKDEDKLMYFFYTICNVFIRRFTSCVRQLFWLVHISTWSYILCLFIDKIKEIMFSCLFLKVLDNIWKGCVRNFVYSLEFHVKLLIYDAQALAARQCPDRPWGVLPSSWALGRPWPLQNSRKHWEAATISSLGLEQNHSEVKLNFSAYDFTSNFNIQ